MLSAGPGALQSAFTTQVEAASTFAITFWMYVPAASKRLQGIVKMGTGTSTQTHDHPASTTSSELNFIINMWPHYYCGVSIGGKLHGKPNGWKYQNFINDASVVQGSSGCPAPDRWCVAAPSLCILIWLRVDRNYISIIMTPTRFDMRVNGFLVYSGLKTKAWPDSLSGQHDLHVGYYHGSTAQDAPVGVRDEHPIRLAHLTYHTDDLDTVMLPPEGIGQYVGATESGHCMFPAVFVQNDPLDTTGFCFQFSLQPEPTCATNGNASVCTKAVFASYAGMLFISWLCVLSHDLRILKRVLAVICGGNSESRHMRPTGRKYRFATVHHKEIGWVSRQACFVLCLDTSPLFDSLTVA